MPSTGASAERAASPPDDVTRARLSLHNLRRLRSTVPSALPHRLRAAPAAAAPAPVADEHGGAGADAGRCQPLHHLQHRSPHRQRLPLRPAARRHSAVCRPSIGPPLPRAICKTGPGAHMHSSSGARSPQRAALALLECIAPGAAASVWLQMNVCCGCLRAVRQRGQPAASSLRQ